jgi:hypothetical protein
MRKCTWESRTVAADNATEAHGGKRNPSYVVFIPSLCPSYIYVVVEDILNLIMLVNYVSLHDTL